MRDFSIKVSGLITILIMFGCSTTGNITSKKSIGFIPIHPLEDIATDYSEIQNDHKAILNNFPNESVQMSITDLTGENSITAAVVSASEKHRVYKVVIDYVKYRSDVVAFKNMSSVKPVIFNTGVGLRMTANLKTLESGVNLTSLYGIGAAAQNNKISGTLSVSTIGLSGPEITPHIPLPSELSIESIQNAIQALASMKAKLYSSTNENISITPQIFSADTDLTEAEVQQMLLKYFASYEEESVDTDS